MHAHVLYNLISSDYKTFLGNYKNNHDFIPPPYKVNVRGTGSRQLNVSNRGVAIRHSTTSRREFEHFLYNPRPFFRSKGLYTVEVLCISFDSLVVKFYFSPPFL